MSAVNQAFKVKAWNHTNCCLFKKKTKTPQKPFGRFPGRKLQPLQGFSVSEQSNTTSSPQISNTGLKDPFFSPKLSILCVLPRRICRVGQDACRSEWRCFLAAFVRWLQPTIHGVPEHYVFIVLLLMNHLQIAKQGIKWPCNNCGVFFWQENQQ